MKQAMHWIGRILLALLALLVVLLLIAALAPPPETNGEFHLPPLLALNFLNDLIN